MKKLAGNLLKYGFLLLGCGLIALPLYLTIANAMKTPQQLSANFFAPPQSLYLDNFAAVISKANFFVYAFNSVFITVVSVTLILIIIPFTAFPIARRMDKEFYYKFLFYFITMGIFIPFQVKMLPLVKLMSSIKMLNPIGLILLYACGALCQDIFLMVGYIKAIPKDMEEASAMDGCSRIQTIWKIVFPIIKPMLATLLIKDSLWIWNDFMMPLLILNVSEKYWTLPLFQYNFKGTYSVDFTMAFAAFSLSIIPMMVVFAFAQKKIMGGLTTGAVKS